MFDGFLAHFVDTIGSRLNIDAGSRRTYNDRLGIGGQPGWIGQYRESRAIRVDASVAFLGAKTSHVALVISIG